MRMRKGNFWTYFSDEGACGLKSLIFLGTEKELRENFIPQEVAEGLRQLQKKEPELMKKMFCLTEERFERSSYVRQIINNSSLSLEEKMVQTQIREKEFEVWEVSFWLPIAEIIYNKLVQLGVSPELIL